MATRNVRPRVLTAINNLGKFTVAELCRAARLTDRDQAYAQIHRLRQDGLLDQRTIPAGERHAPFKEYSLVADPVKRAEFARELAEFHPGMGTVQAAQSLSELGQLALDEATRELTRIETNLAGIEALPVAEAERELAVAGTELDTVWTNVETAHLEYHSAGSAEQTLNATLVEAELRWRKVETKLVALKADHAHLRSKPDWSLLLRDAAHAVCSVLAAKNGLAMSVAAGVMAAAKVAVKLGDLSNDSAYSAAREVLLDEIQADAQHPFVPVLLQALRIGDAKLVLDILNMFRGTHLAWWNYNLENATYLATSKLRFHDWLAAYSLLYAPIDNPAHKPFQVYSCRLDQMTRDRYLSVTKNQQVSIVSPRPIEFLGVHENVQPTLLVERGSVLKALECGFLNPLSGLSAYGPIANDIGFSHGAPDLRVAACLGRWGLPVEKHLPGITAALQSNRGIVVLQGTERGLSRDVARGLDAKMIAEWAEGATVSAS